MKLFCESEKFEKGIQLSPVNEHVIKATRMGTVVSMALSGWLCSSEYLGGWPSVFYVFGTLGLIWGVLWFILIRESPKLHPRISDKELKYILKGCPVSTEQVPVPWISMITSKYFWSISASHFGIAWSSLTLLTQLPTYLDTILHIKMENNGLLSALPFLASWVFTIVFSFFLNTLVTKNVIALVTMRRIAMVFGGYFPSIIIISLCFIDCNKNLALAIFIIIGICLGCPFSGVMNSHADIAPRFSGTFMGLTNTIASCPGFISPLLASYITNENHTISAWNKVFIIYSAISIVTTTIYISCITTKIQPWNEPKKEDNKEIKKNDCPKEEKS
ncbi:putative inorganic phosphate cotransporter [Armadillidium nasatum]|uniref:Putative inorganic phosphate cotransporter n=1 Tax=Armadillidium nasatum TaxID=96803 RepID=A0A5N5SQZ9_9CRUS|nr:putative inorganic phosphate cotransporter [Armadillidium nasatum]